MKEYQELFEAYQKVCEQQKIGIPLDAPTDAAAARKLREILPPSEKDKVLVPKTTLQKAHYEIEGEVVIEDVYDEVLKRLLEEGNTLEESIFMMSNIDEGMFSNIQNALKMYKMMTGIEKVPAKVAPSLTDVWKGVKPVASKPKPFQIGTPPKPVATPKPNISTPAAAASAGTLALSASTSQSKPENKKPEALNKPYTSPFAGARDSAFSKAKNIQGSPVVGQKKVDSGSPAPKPLAKSTSASVTPSTPKPEVKGPQWPPLTPPPPVEKKSSLSSDIDYLRGMIERSKSRQKEMTDKINNTNK